MTALDRSRVCLAVSPPPSLPALPTPLWASHPCPPPPVACQSKYLGARYWRRRTPPSLAAMSNSLSALGGVVRRGADQTLSEMATQLQSGRRTIRTPHSAPTAPGRPAGAATMRTYSFGCPDSNLRGPPAGPARARPDSQEHQFLLLHTQSVVRLPARRCAALRSCG